MKKLNNSLLDENIDRIIQFDVLNKKIFGSAYYVFQEGNTALEKCYGKASLNTDNPITNSTIFRLASMTKPITAVAALILVDRGLLSLDDTVDKYIPDYKNVPIIDPAENKYAAPENLPTIRNILSHTSGIGSNYDKLADMTEKDKSSLDNAISFYLKSGLDFEPGSKQQYSGTAAFNVLAKIIEIISGTDYLSFLEKEVFIPCNMCDTTFVPSPEQQKRIVDMHAKIDNENATFKMIDGCIFEDFPWTLYLGGAGLVSSLQDYCNFAKMLLNKGKTEKKQLMSEETFNSLCTPQVSEDIMPGKERWGLGVRVITDDSYPYLPKGTFGWSGAYGSHFWIDPINKIFAVYMKNSKYDGGGGNQSAVNFERAVYTSF